MPDTPSYRGPLVIEKAKGLKRLQRRIERRFAGLVQASAQIYVDAYLFRNGKRLNTDDARELSDDYARSFESRAYLASAVQEPAGAIVKEAWRQRLLAPAGENLVVFTAGGAGSGKTSAIHDVPSARILERSADAVYDTTMADLFSSRRKVRQALDAGKEVIVFYVFRPLEAAIQGVLERAERKGRTVPLAILVHDHFHCPRTFLQLAKELRNEPRFTPIVLNNSGKPGACAIGDLEFLHQTAYSDLLDPAGIRRRIRKVIQDEYNRRTQSGATFPTHVYEGILGQAPR